MKLFAFCMTLLLASVSFGAISPVQSNATWGATGPTCAVAFSSNPANGHLIVVWTSWTTSTAGVTAGVADTRSNAYLSAIGPTIQSASNTAGQIFYAKNITGGSNTVTVTFSSAPTSSNCVIGEVSGADPTNPLDSVTAGYSSSAGTLLDSGATIPANPNLLLFAGGTGDAGTASVGTGFTLVQKNGGSVTEYALPVGNNELQRAEATLSSSGNWVMQLAVFRDASWTAQGGWSPVRPGGVRYADQFPGVDIGDQVNQAIASLPTTGGEVFIPCGIYVLSTQIAITTNVVWLHGCGTKGTANAGPHSNTVLIWSGGAGAVILASGASATGSKISGLSFDNTGTATVAIDVDAAASEVKIEDVGIAQPQIPFSVAGIRYGNNSSVCCEYTRDVSMYSAAPVGMLVNQLSANSANYNLHISASTSFDVTLGNASTGPGAISWYCYGCALDVPVDGAVPVNMQRVESGGLYGGYIEQGNSASATAYSIETTGAAFIRNFNFVGVSFRSVATTPSKAAIHQNFSSTQLNLIASEFTGFANPGYVIQNDVAPQMITLVQNSLVFNGASLVTGAASANNIQSFSNVLAGSIANPSSDLASLRIGGTSNAILTSSSALTQTIASGTAAMTTALIGSGSCGAVVTVAAAGTQTTDAVNWSWDGAPGATDGRLNLNTWPTASNVNFQYCNPTAGSLTPVAATLNWNILR